MKVGGNESATLYYQRHGGSAALKSTNPSTKYDNAGVAGAYKTEIQKRAARDAEL